MPIPTPTKLPPLNGLDKAKQRLEQAKMTDFPGPTLIPPAKYTDILKPHLDKAIRDQNTYALNTVSYEALYTMQEYIKERRIKEASEIHQMILKAYIDFDLICNPVTCNTGVSKPPTPLSRIDKRPYYTPLDPKKVYQDTPAEYPYLYP